MKKVGIKRPNFVGRVKRHADVLRIGFGEAVAKNRMTSQYPRERRELPENFRGMIQLDIEKCRSCCWCTYVCPANAIAMERGPDMKLYPSIDYANCIFCHFCIEACSHGALKSTDISDVAFSRMEDMLLTAEKLLYPPELPREEESIVSYEISDGELSIVKQSVSEEK